MADEHVKQEVLGVLLRETPVTLWRSVLSGLTWAYSEGFASVRSDARVLAAQKPAKLIDDRFYLAETALHEAASASGVVSSGQKVELNGWAYTMVRSGGVCMVQSYTRAPSDFSRPARFREQHAALNDFLSRPQFAFGDVDPTLFDISKVAGIVIHGPVNKKFDEEGQRLGFANFCVPSEDYRFWEVNFPLAEIVAVYGEKGAASPAQRDIARPTPRRDKKEESDKSA